MKYLKSYLILTLLFTIVFSKTFSQKENCCTFKTEKLTIHENLYSNTMTPEYKGDNTVWNDSLLNIIEKFIRLHNADSIQIRYHSTVRGSEEYNLKTSKNVAIKIKLKLNTIFPEIYFNAVGCGEKNPLIEERVIKQERDILMRRKLHNINSRVEFIITNSVKKQ